MSMTQQGDANGNLWPCSKLLQHPPQVRGFRLKDQHQSEHSDQFNPFFLSGERQKQKYCSAKINFVGKTSEEKQTVFFIQQQYFDLN